MADLENTEEHAQDIVIKISKEGLVSATLAGETVDITPGDAPGQAKVKAYTTHIQVEPAFSAAAKKGGLVICINDDLSGISVHGVDVAAATADSPLIVTNGLVSIETPALKKLEIGDRDSHDGWIYAGISPDKDKPMFVAPADAGIMNWDDATDLASTLHKKGVKEARLPSRNELTCLFHFRAQIGGFDQTGVYGNSWYWSSESSRLFPDRAMFQWFDRNGQSSVHKKQQLSTRLVRS